MATILHRTVKKAFVPTAIALFISACTSVNPVTESIKNEAYSSSEFYINKADQTKQKEDKISYQLLAVRKLIDENKEYEAQTLFSEIMTTEMNEVQKLEYALVSAQLSALQGKNAQATSLLKAIQEPLLSPAQRLRYIHTQARIAENQNDVIGIVRARSLLNQYYRMNRERQENNDMIWQTLRGANRGMLANTMPEAGEMELAGWLALINLYNQNITTPAQMPQAINNWKNQYPSHSAITVMPTELQGVSNFQQTQLNSVALLLPLSSDAKILGDIIQKGFNDAKADDPTNVQIFDTDLSDVNSIIAQAKQQGANIVVGPLLKSRVDEMLAGSELQNINVLALNATENVRNIPQLCYYGLSPESEAQSGAEKMYRDGHRVAIVAAPQDDFGHRSAEAFAKRWRQLTGADADVRYYYQPLDSVAAIQNAGISRAGLYILGNAEQVLDIKQGVDNSNLKERLALYTSSRSNSPNNGIDFYTSMEGVKFSEVPLLADPTSNEYKKAENLASSDFSMMRLYAMGADAWALANKFNEFRHIPGYKVSGLTGELSAGQNCNIERNLSWMQYHNGAIQQAY
ncbi:penicillin-binding protein activator [Mannheimia sp. AT1]|uniref:Penicillin-binding protein activator LpoA n=1 Tax=Mannheimia cairinae TaxID=3025936 RepID=A0ABT5MQT4_9PAST|nr:penicillin-binding protein activator [Mannheimia cairinae]MDD0823222.1 penicillin-binding protein activator [Mannheimia cairinae]MDD0825752.1 penicillin-binding protein activator [Mannheimia cairinae]